MVCTATAQIPQRNNYVMAAAILERDIFCVSLIRLLSPPHVQDASLDAALIGFPKL